MSLSLSLSCDTIKEHRRFLKNHILIICNIYSVMGHLNTNNFLFLFFYFSDFILIFFSLFFSLFFSFGQWRGMWHCSHMTGHIMWHHRPRTWWKDLEDNVRALLWQPLITKDKWSTMSKSLRWIYCGKFTRELDKESKLESYIYRIHMVCAYILMSTSFLTQGHHVVYMCPDVIFQILLLCSRPMMSHHVTCHVTTVSCTSSLSKRKIKKKKRKINIKSEK